MMAALMVAVALQSSSPVAGLTGDQYEAAIHQLREEIDEGLLDYQAVRFRDIALSSYSAEGDVKGLYFCGEMNAKNSNGGYTGWQVISGGFRFTAGDPHVAVVIFDTSVVTDRYARDLTESDAVIGHMACVAVVAGFGSPTNAENSSALNP